MSDSNHYSGAITITPPLTWSQIKDCKDVPGAGDATLVVKETWIEDGDTRTVTSTASQIIATPLDGEARHLTEYIQAVVDRFPDHKFGGHITIDWESGYGDPCPSRYVVRGRRVEEVKARLVWPDEERLPVRMSPEQVAGLLSDMAARVAAGDSFDGTITYSTDYESDDPELPQFLVTAIYRVGNSMGQGGTRIIEGRGVEA